MAAGRGGPGTSLFKSGSGRVSYLDRLERIKTLPEEKLTDGDKAARLVEASQLLAVQCLIKQARAGSPTAAKTLLEMGGLYQPGLRITGEIDHQHEHRVLQVNVRELTAAEFALMQRGDQTLLEEALVNAHEWDADAAPGAFSEVEIAGDE